MSRWEFMRRLEELLADISPSEREEALQYYNDYFNDAGRENEAEVINALGTPEQVARIVREGLGENGNQGEFTENGFTNSSGYTENALIRKNADSSSVENKDVVESKDTAAGGSTESKDAASGSALSDQSGKEKKSMPVWAVVLIVIACVLLSPAILGLVIIAVSVIITVFAALFGVIFGIGLTMIVLYIVAFSLVIAGFGVMLPHPITGVGLIGGGLICAAVGILFMLLLVFLVGKCIPATCQGIGYIFKKIFGKKGGARA